MTKMQKPLNAKSILSTDPFIIARQLTGEAWKAIESQPDIHTAIKARDILARHSLKRYLIPQNDYIRIFRTKDIIWE